MIDWDYLYYLVKERRRKDKRKYKGCQSQKEATSSWVGECRGLVEYTILLELAVEEHEVQNYYLVTNTYL